MCLAMGVKLKSPQARGQSQNPATAGGDLLILHFSMSLTHPITPPRAAQGPARPATLLLADGTRFEGLAAGATGISAGEICFNTGMSGYQEIFTDPSYYGQVVTLTHTHIGNYGVHPDEAESHGVKIAGLVCRNFSHLHSRADASGGLHEYLAAAGVAAIYGLDTRALVRHIRERGAMNCVIATDGSPIEALQARLGDIPNMEGLALADAVATREPFVVAPTPGTARGLRVAALDLGIKRNILRCLTARGLEVHVFPWDSPAEALLSIDPHGFFISNGPGDPAALDGPVATIQALLQTQKPLFGICMGHQLLARAMGLPTFKLKYGHRGLNHPVKNLLRDRSEMTSQNHGFAVVRQATEAHPDVELTHVHLNDGTVQGLRLRHQPAFSVQYHPEASPGPHDSRYLFDDFVAMLG